MVVPSRRGLPSLMALFLPSGYHSGGQESPMEYRPRVFIASPLSGNLERNMQYARFCMEHSLMLGESPLAPHLLYPQVLDDDKSDERVVGMDCGLNWLTLADKLAVYSDLGLSEGMNVEIEKAVSQKVPVEYRTVDVYLGVGDEQTSRS